MQLVKIDDHQWIDADRVISVHGNQNHVNGSVLIFMEAEGNTHPVRTNTPLDELMPILGVED
jgi:hypothetical protein